MAVVWTTQEQVTHILSDYNMYFESWIMTSNVVVSQCGDGGFDRG